MASIISWLRQTTTGAGFSALIGTVVAMASGQLAWQAALPLIVGGVLAIAWPEKPGLRADAETVVDNALKVYADATANSATSGTTAPSVTVTK
jgi:hypothetical protein